MFKWFRTTGGGLQQVEQLFTGMLHDGRRAFDLARHVRLDGADPAATVDELLRTEARTDQAEQHIRRLILVHASVAGSADVPACLMYMSVAKDAERIADLSKNVFGIAEAAGSVPRGLVRDDMAGLCDAISPMIAEAARIFAEDDPDAADVFIDRARELQERCKSRITELLRGDGDPVQPAASVLTYRQLSRILANLLNIVSAVVMPLDLMDYPEPDTEV